MNDPLMANPAPWRNDPGWRQLLDMVWYRVRPANEHVELSCYERHDPDGPNWSIWVVCIRYGTPAAGLPTNSYCYGLRRGELEPFGFVHG